MFGKYQYRERTVAVARVLDLSEATRHQSRSTGIFVSGFFALIVLALFLTFGSARAEGQVPQQMEFARAPAPIAEANAPVAIARDGNQCANCASQAKIVLAWQYPLVDEFMVFFARDPSAEFLQITPQSPAVRTPNNEYEIQIDAGLELGASVGELVCFKVQAASVIESDAGSEQDSTHSAIMCSELQS